MIKGNEMTFYIMTAQGWKPWLASIPVTDNHNDIQGVYRPVSTSEAEGTNHDRATKFCNAIDRWLDGDDFGTTDSALRWQAMWRAAGVNDPVYGAFGERL